MTATPSNFCQKKYLADFVTRVCCGVFVLVCIYNPNMSAAADPDMVGMLADAVNPTVARSIGLDEQQLQQLNSLISMQEIKALDMADKMRELPQQDRSEMLAKSIRDLEEQAFALLTIQQRSQLEQVRLNRLGLKSLAQPHVSATLGLSDGQQEQITQILASRIELLREFGAEKADGEMQKRLRKVLTEVQYRTFQAMAGISTSASDMIATQTISPRTDEAEEPAQDPAKSGDQQANADFAAAMELIDSVEAAKLNSSPVLTASGDQADLLLNFNSNDWSSVLQWIAREAELSLQVDTIPPGTFTYRDPYRRYTVAQALDIMNGVLLGKGYTLVRRQRTLMVIDLGSGESAEVTRGLIRELAQLVAPDKLGERGDFELLKSLFVLSRMTAEEAEKQIRPLIGPQGSVIPLTSAGQILVVETGANLRLIRDMIERVENPDSSRTTKIASLPLTNVTAEEVLSIARPLLGLPPDTNQAEGINLSTDTFGNMIFATGDVNKLQLLRDIIAKVDIAPGAGGPTSVTVEQPTLRTHRIVGSDAELTMNVLQTLLAGTPNVRLALDTKTNSIIASATATDHKIVEQTLAELAGEGSQFAIIHLSRIDPQAAIITLEKFFGVTAATSATAAAATPAAMNDKPIFYGDNFARTLMVKGTKVQVDQVKEIISKIEESGPSNDLLGDKVKLIPTKGKNADRLIEQMQIMWDAQNKKSRIRVRGASDNDGEPETLKTGTRRTTLGGGGGRDSSSVAPREQIVPHGQLVQTAAEAFDEGLFEEDQTTSPEINIIRSPNGLIVTSDDPKLLAEFEQMAMLLSDQMSTSSTEPTIFYLKYVPAASAAELLKQILSGKTSANGSLLGSVAGNVLGQVGGSMVSGLMGGGSTSSGSGIASGATSIVADPRLNYLLVQANSSDLDLIEELLRVIDQEDSPLSIQTKGRPQIIPVIYSNADDIAKIVKEVFADRLAQAPGAGGNANGGGGGNRQPSPQDFFAALAGGGGGRGNRGGGGGGGEANNQAAPMKEATMTIGVDSRNNAIIVSGPNSLYLQVKELVELLDQGTEANQEAIEVVQLGGSLNATVAKSAIQSILGPQAKVKDTSNTATSGTPISANNANSNQGDNSALSQQQIQQRINAFRQFGGGGGGGRGFGGGGFGQGGGGFGGGGGGFGGGGGNAAGGRGGTGGGTGRRGGN